MSKCVFDGANKTISPLPEYSSIDVKTDIYSAWKSWVIEDNNMIYDSAIRVIGGDPIGSGVFAGDIYFLTNGWKITVSHRLVVNGVLYDDSGADPFIISAGGSVRSVVSSLVQSLSTSGSNIDYDAIATAVTNKIDTTSSKLSQIKTILDDIDTKVSSMSSDSLADVMVELEKIKSKIDDTQAFVLSA